MATRIGTARQRLSRWLGRKIWGLLRSSGEHDPVLQAEIATLRDTVDGLVRANDALRKEILATNRRISWNERVDAPADSL